MRGLSKNGGIQTFSVAMVLDRRNGRRWIDGVVVVAAVAAAAAANDDDIVLSYRTKHDTTFRWRIYCLVKLVHPSVHQTFAEPVEAVSRLTYLTIILTAL